VFRKAGGINAGPQSASLFAGGAIPANVSESTVFPGGAPEGGSDQPKKKADDNVAFFGLIAVAIAAFLIIKKRRG
jgi:hypothetical protein